MIIINPESIVRALSDVMCKAKDKGVFGDVSWRIRITEDKAELFYFVLHGKSTSLFTTEIEQGFRL